MTFLTTTSAIHRSIDVNLMGNVLEDSRLAVNNVEGLQGRKLLLHD
jgi:hypothetical protein